MCAKDLGPRRTALLEGWAERARTTATGPGFDLSDENRTRRTEDRVAAFLDERSEDAFRDLWTHETLADAVIGGPDLVLNRWDDLEELAETIDAIRTASAYDPDWESNFSIDTAVWELYGRLHADSEPIVYSECTRGLEIMGRSRPATFSDAKRAWAAFERVYDDHVGHATRGTDHEVPVAHEMSEFLRFVATQDEDTVKEQLGSDEEYRPLTGWRTTDRLESDIEFSGLEPHLDGYVEAKREGGLEEDGPDDLWNRGYWESWKDEYREHVETVVRRKYDLTDLEPADVEPLLDDLTESTSLSTPIPAYMLGGRQGGIIWSGFEKRSLEDPEEAAAVLSYLFDDENHVNVRLDRFGTFYGELDDGGGQLLSLATILLTFAYPREYVLYRWSLMSAFFGEFADYRVRTGFNTDQYWKLNVACKRLLAELDRRLEDPTMLDVHTILYVYAKEYADS